jgi:hypothetical protein
MLAEVLAVNPAGRKGGFDGRGKIERVDGQVR